MSHLLAYETGSKPRIRGLAPAQHGKRTLLQQIHRMLSLRSLLLALANQRDNWINPLVCGKKTMPRGKIKAANLAAASMRSAISQDNMRCCYVRCNVALRFTSLHYTLHNISLGDKNKRTELLNPKSKSG